MLPIYLLASEELVHRQRSCEDVIHALARAGAPLESLEAILDFGCGRVLRRWHSLDARIRV
jgi:hypothetical protein